MRTCLGNQTKYRCSFSAATYEDGKRPTSRRLFLRREQFHRLVTSNFPPGPLLPSGRFNSSHGRRFFRDTLVIGFAEELEELSTSSRADRVTNGIVSRGGFRLRRRHAPGRDPTNPCVSDSGV